MLITKDKLDGVPTHGMGRLNTDRSLGNGLGRGVARRFLTNRTGAALAQKTRGKTTDFAVLPGNLDAVVHTINGLRLNAWVRRTHSLPLMPIPLLVKASILRFKLETMLSLVFWFRKSLYLAVLLLSLSACHFKSATLMPPTPEHRPVPIKDAYVFLINLDGSRPQEIERWVDEGYLPHFKKLFFEEGAVFVNAINSYPTLSTPNHQSFISGLFPGHHGIPALDWFSRPLREHIDYLKLKHLTYANVLMFNYLQLLNGEVFTDEPQLLFADLKGHPTLAVLEASNFGATTYLPKRPPAKGAIDFYYRDTYETMDWIALKNTLKHLKQSSAKDFPRFSFINFYGIDNLGHFVGADSERALDFYIHYDRVLGELMDLLKKRGLWEKSSIIVVSDHGQHYIQEIIDQKALLRRVGFPLKYQSAEKNFIVWGDHGTGTSNLHLRIDENWQRPPTYAELRNFPMPSGGNLDLVEAFLKEQSIEFVLARENAATTHVFSKDASGKRHHARILKKWQNDKMYYRYDPGPGDDPFAYLGEAPIQKWVKQKSYQDAEAWLKATAHLQRPDAVVGVGQIFSDGRSGEMIIQTYADKQFKETKLSAHGSLEREDRRVNLMFHGPDIKAGRYPYARIVDVYPTLLALFGLENPAPMDGVLRAEILDERVLASPKTTLRHPMAKGKNVAEFLEILETTDLSTLDKSEQEKVLQLRFELKESLRDASLSESPL